jgi:DNA primase
VIGRDDQKQQVQQSTDLVRLIGEQVALKSRGKEYIGLCPFHDDKNPSLYVSPAKQIYKCFSCGAGGDAFSFVMNFHKMTFPEALRYLADRAGIKLVTSGYGSEHSADASQGPTDRQRIAAAHPLAASFFRALLRHSEHGRIAREYLARRGVNADMIEAFGIGYAPDRWDGLVTVIRQEGWDLGAFELAGLVSRRQSGEGYYDRFRHRLMFPICDAIGRVIAFGGRKLREEDEPKYLNSPESVLFNKSATLYGLHLAKKAVLDTRTAVIVEGYTDVVACHQAAGMPAAAVGLEGSVSDTSGSTGRMGDPGRMAGAEQAGLDQGAVGPSGGSADGAPQIRPVARNVIATLGTALTAQHVAELRRYCDKVVLVYDGDEAGVKASDRAVEVFLGEALDVSIAVLPDELDPADLLGRPGGAEIWNRCIAEARDALQFQFERVAAQVQAADTVTGREKLAEDYLRKLAALGLERSSIIKRDLVLYRVAELFRLPEPSLRALAKRLAAAARPMAIAARGAGEAVASEPATPKMRGLQTAEQQLLGCLLLRPELFHTRLADGRTLDEALVPADFITPPAAKLYAMLSTRLIDRQEISLAALLRDLAQADELDLAKLATLAEAQASEQAGENNPQGVEALAVGAADAIRTHHRDQEYEELRGTTPAPAGSGEVDANLRRIAEHNLAHPSPVRIGRLRA